MFLLGTTGVLAGCASGTTAPQTTPVVPIASVTAGAATVPSSITTTTAQAPLLVTDPFSLGVASGDPLATSVILWTRLAGGNQGTGQQSIEVRWEVAIDASFTSLAGAGVASASEADGWTVHVDCTLPPSPTRYFYRFMAGGHTSPVGRTRTAPPDGTEVASWRFGFGSCQHYETGFYSAHGDIASHHLDAFFWLGDYIYEYGANPVDPAGGRVRAHTGSKLTTVDDYRARYALYKSDPNLQAAHASCPWFVTWDDHEVENNYAANQSANPATATAEFLALRAAAYKVWWENMPTRLPRPVSADYTVYRRFTWGNLATISLLDGRQYRSDQACGDRVLSLEPPCAEAADDARTMLGAQQEAWLLDGISASSTAWNVVGNQTVMSDATLNGAVLNFDQWDGYPAARRRLLGGIEAAKKTNVVVLTGDIHFAGVGTVTTGAERRSVATEFVGTSISSVRSLPAGAEAALSAIPDLKYLNAKYRGWSLCEVTPTSWTTTFRIVDDVLRPNATLSSDATFRVTPDKPGATRI